MSGSIRFGSVCSGIEAASVAWGTLGWKAAWLSEIEPFPCAVLKHHYPDVPNYGDMTLLPARITSGEVEAPDLFCGGTPCQAFSVAGLRNSLDDARGNLSLTFCEIANAIDDRRSVRGESPSIVFWENVPGVLNTKDNAFGCFLGALAGEDEALIAPGGRWTNAGFIDGPQRAVAWRVLDAQYFGVAQRRRRVFVVASARDDFDPASVLFEFEGVRRDIAPSRQEGQRIAPCVTNGPPFSRTGNERVEAEAMVIADCGVQLSGPLSARDYKDAGTDGMNKISAKMVPVTSYTPSSIGGYREGVGTLRANGGDIGGGSENLVTARMVAFGEYSIDGTASAMKARDWKDATDLIAQPIAFENNRRDGARLYGDVSNTLQAFAGTGGGNGPMVAQPVGTDCFNGNITGDIACTMGTMGSSVNASGPTVMQVVPFQETADCLTSAYGTKWNGNASATNGSLFAKQSMAVRRLTPTECERLQGFPDGYTNIPWRKAAESPDGPRYKALGNSWAVPVVRWIGERIARAT